MTLSFLGFLALAGSLGLFIFGMKQMSDGLQKLTGPLMRWAVGAMSASRMVGVLTGLLITALVQSSSASTVMVVSFVNAGLLSLSESIAVIMGANIGTTVTSWLVAGIGLRVGPEWVALPLLALGAPLLFFRKSRLNAWAQAVFGLALLFISIWFMRNAVPDASFEPDAAALLMPFADLGPMSILLFVAVGTVLTMMVQSSSAAIALVLVMAVQGWLSFAVAAAMVLGCNIGTTITANLAAIVGNVHAKRAARAHLLFNVAGLLWALPLFWPALEGIDALMGLASAASPFADRHALPIALSVFHTGFNVANALFFFYLIPQIDRLVTRMQPSQGDERFQLEFIGKGLVQTAEISLHEAQKEVIKFAGIDRNGVALLRDLINETERKEQRRLIAKLSEVEELTDSLELSIDRYLTELSGEQLSEASSVRTRSLLVAVNHLETIGDIFVQMARTIERKVEKKVWFDQSQRDDLNQMQALVDKAIVVMQRNIGLAQRDVDLGEASAIEKEINALRHLLRGRNFKKIEKGKVKLEAGLIYNDLLSGFEKIGDNIFSVSEAMKGVNIE